MRPLKELRCMRLMVVSLFCVLLMGPVSQELQGKTINANVELKQRLFKRCTHPELRKFLNDRSWDLKTFDFKGTAKSSGIEYKFPGGISIEKGELKIDDSFLQKPESIYQNGVRNYYQREIEMLLSLNGGIIQSESWSNTDSIETSVSLETEVKCLFGGSKVAVGAEYGHTWENTKSEETKKEWEFALNVPVGPREMVRGSIVVQRLKLDIPYWFDIECKGKTTATFRSNETKNWGVTIYEHSNYRGKSKEYRLDGNKELHIKNLFWTPYNDMISSIKIRGNVKVEFFQHDNYKGYRDTYTKSCSSVAHHDAYTSLRIYMLDNDKTIKFNLEEALPGKADRSFRINGTWSGISAYNAIGIICPGEPLDESIPQYYSMNGSSKRKTLAQSLRKEVIKKGDTVSNKYNWKVLLRKMGDAAQELKNTLDKKTVENAQKDIEVLGNKSKKFIGKIIPLKTKYKK